MVKGRRAAERRRERQGKEPDEGASLGASAAGADDGLTKPSMSVDHRGIGEEPHDDSLPVVSHALPVELPPIAEGPKAERSIHARGAPDNDPEASFIHAMRQTAAPQRGTVGAVTAVRTAPQRTPRVGARLVVLEGPDQGGEADLDVIPSLVGRAAIAEIGLTDPTISLRHFELRQASSGEGYALIDLGSSSGTLVNGAPAEGEVGLRHGDVIALGKTTMRFLRGDKQPAPRPEPAALEEAVAPLETTERLDKTQAQTPAQIEGRTEAEASRRDAAPPPDVAIVRARVRTTTKGVIAACFAILVVAVAGKLVHAHWFSDHSPKQIRGQVAALLTDGRNRLRDQDIEGASASALTVLALEEGNEDARSLLKMAATETEAQAAAALAQRMGDAGRDVEAAQILKRIPDSSVFAPARDRLRTTLSERGQVGSRQTIAARLAQGRVTEALAAAEKHVITYPDDEQGKPLLERVREAHKNAPRNPELAEARAAFAAGDVGRAREIAVARGLNGYLRDLDRFDAALGKGKAALARFDGEAAQSLHEAFSLLGALGGSASSPVFAEVKRPYGKALFIAGTGKLQGDASERCQGARDVYRASAVLGDDPAIQQKLRELQDLALAGLEKARAARAQDGARSVAIAREHGCLAKPGTKTHEELQSLARP